MMKDHNSRRNFLSSIAVLSAGTAMGGSPVNLLYATDQTIDLQKAWRSFLNNAGANKYTGISLPALNIEYKQTSGHVSQLGEMVYLEKENVLAQPVWIYWAGNKLKPADVVINIYENLSPYKKIVTLNRYELSGLLKVYEKTGEEQLIVASGIKGPAHENEPARLHTKTTIKKRSQEQDISFYKGRELVLNHKCIYHT